VRPLFIRLPEDSQLVIELVKVGKLYSKQGVLVQNRGVIYKI